MTRTNNTLRVTFSANIDAGEGYLTERNDTALYSTLDYDWLWTKDVVSDWKSDIDRILETAQAGFLGWYDSTSPNAEPAKSVEELAERLWLGGVWPDGSMCVQYEEEAGVDLDDECKIDDYACGPDFFDWMIVRAKQDAKQAVADMRNSGVKYNHGRHPSYSDLLMFYVLSELIGKYEDPKTAIDLERRHATYAEKQAVGVFEAAV